MNGLIKSLRRHVTRCFHRIPIRHVIADLLRVLFQHVVAALFRIQVGSVPASVAVVVPYARASKLRGKIRSGRRDIADDPGSRAVQGTRLKAGTRLGLRARMRNEYGCCGEPDGQEHLCDSMTLHSGSPPANATQARNESAR